MIEIIARRTACTLKTSVALWSGPGLPIPLYCLEPGEHRFPNPRIPAGTYPLRLRTLGSKHADYKAHYDAHARFGPGWHCGMIEICAVPARTAIEFHIGNYMQDTLGCSLAGKSYAKGPDGEYQVHDSRAAYEDAYPVIRDLILAGPTQVSIRDAIGEMS